MYIVLLIISVYVCSKFATLAFQNKLNFSVAAFSAGVIIIIGEAILSMFFYKETHGISVSSLGFALLGVVGTSMFYFLEKWHAARLKRHASNKTN